MTERIELYTVLEVTDDEEAINLIMNIKNIVIVAEPGYSIKNMPHSTSLVLYGTIVRYYQYNTESATEHYQTS